MVDGQDLVEFEFVLDFVAFVTLKQHPAKSFAVREDAVESTNFALPRLCADARSNNAWQIEIQLTSNSRFAAAVAVVDVAIVVAAVELVAIISAAGCSSTAVECEWD